MSMGNYLRGRTDSVTMAAQHASGGMDHPTVVPANFDPDAVEESDDDAPDDDR